MVVGAGAIQAGAQAAVRALAEGFDIPVATSLGGRGIVPTTHPLHIGTVGTYSAPPGNRLVAEADLVIFVGCHAGDQPTSAYTVPAPGTAIIQIDLDGQEIGRNYPNTTAVWGCPRRAVGDLAAALTTRKGWAAWAAHARAVVAEWRAGMEPHCISDAAPIRVERLCREISGALPENGVLVADTGYSGIWTATMLELPHEGQSYLRAAGSLGWSFPAALGAQMGRPPGRSSVHRRRGVLLPSRRAGNAAPLAGAAGHRGQQQLGLRAGRLQGELFLRGPKAARRKRSTASAPPISPPSPATSASRVSASRTRPIWPGCCATPSRRASRA